MYKFHNSYFAIFVHFVNFVKIVFSTPRNTRKMLVVSNTQNIFVTSTHSRHGSDSFVGWMARATIRCAAAAAQRIDGSHVLGAPSNEHLPGV